MDIKIGDYNVLEVQRFVEFGLYLNDGDKGILLPGRWVPENTVVGDLIKVFICHDGEDRLIATTLTPKAIVGEIAYLKVVTVNRMGAFLDYGLMKDVFVPTSQQATPMEVGESYFVKLYIDEKTDRIAATQWFEKQLTNTVLTIKALEEVDVLIYRKTQIGYVVIINQKHLGLLHFNEIYQPIQIGNTYKGFVKNIGEENKLDIVLGKQGYKRIEDETEKIVRLLSENDGSLFYNDKSSPESIYAFFGMSKKSFKMALGNLYKQKKITITPEGIALV